MRYTTKKAKLWLFYNNITSGSQVTWSQFNNSNEVFKSELIEVATHFGSDLPSAITKDYLETFIGKIENWTRRSIRRKTSSVFWIRKRRDH
jgi:hypothetical protein